MASSTPLSGVGFYVETSRALRKDTARYVKKIEAAGGTTHWDPLDPRVSIIIVFPPDRHASHLVVPVGPAKNNALALTLLNRWTYLDLISHFARSAYGTDVDRGHMVESSEKGRYKYTKVFTASWLGRVIQLKGSIGELWTSAGILPLPLCEVWADPRTEPTGIGSGAGPSTSAAVAPGDPDAARMAFLLARPPHTPAAWLERAAGEMVSRKRRRASILAPEQSKHATRGHTSEEEAEAESSSANRTVAPALASDPADEAERKSRSSTPQAQGSSQGQESSLQRQESPEGEGSSDGRESPEAEEPPRTRGDSEDSEDLYP